MVSNQNEAPLDKFKDALNVNETPENIPEAPTKDSVTPDEELTTLHERSLAALSYVGFLAIVPFYLAKDSKFCRFHGKQGMLLAIMFFFAKLLLVLDFFMDIALILQFSIFVGMGFAALSGRWKKLPWVYNTACQIEEHLSIKLEEEKKVAKKYKPNEKPEPTKKDSEKPT